MESPSRASVDAPPRREVAGAVGRHSLFGGALSYYQVEREGAAVRSIRVIRERLRCCTPNSPLKTNLRFLIAFRRDVVRPVAAILSPTLAMADEEINTLGLEESLLDGGVHLTHFFNGRLLTAEAFQVEQAGAEGLRRRVARAAGEGVVDGLWVRSTAEPRAVVVSGGTALARDGSTVEIAASGVRVALTVTGRTGSSPSAPDGGASPGPGDGPIDPCAADGFVDCSGDTASVDLQDLTTDGGLLLVVGPATGYRGFATVATEAAAGNCGRRDLVRGARFRLVPLPSLPAEFPAGGGVRSRLAHQCLGSFEFESEAGFLDASGGPPLDAIERLRADDVAGPLLPCEVPLALIGVEGGQIAFVDNWAARRRVARPAELAPSEARAWARWRHTEALIDELGGNTRLQARLTYLTPLFTVSAGSTAALQQRLAGLRLREPALVSRRSLPRILQVALQFPPRRSSDVQELVPLELEDGPLDGSMAGEHRRIFILPEVACEVCLPAACAVSGEQPPVVQRAPELATVFEATARAHRKLVVRLIEREGPAVPEQPNRREWRTAARAEAVEAHALALATLLRGGADAHTVRQAWAAGLAEAQLRFAMSWAAAPSYQPVGVALEALTASILDHATSIQGSLAYPSKSPLAPGVLCETLGRQRKINAIVDAFDFDELEEKPIPQVESMSLTYVDSSDANGLRAEAVYERQYADVRGIYPSTLSNSYFDPRLTTEVAMSVGFGAESRAESLGVGPVQPRSVAATDLGSATSGDFAAGLGSELFSRTVLRDRFLDHRPIDEVFVTPESKSLIHTFRLKTELQTGGPFQVAVQAKGLSAQLLNSSGQPVGSGDTLTLSRTSSVTDIRVAVSVPDDLGQDGVVTVAVTDGRANPSLEQVQATSTVSRNLGPVAPKWNLELWHNYDDVPLYADGDRSERFVEVLVPEIYPGVYDMLIDYGDLGDRVAVEVVSGGSGVEVVDKGLFLVGGERGIKTIDTQKVLLKVTAADGQALPPQAVLQIAVAGNEASAGYGASTLQLTP